MSSVSLHPQDVLEGRHTVSLSSHRAGWCSDPGGLRGRSQHLAVKSQSRLRHPNGPTFTTNQERWNETDCQLRTSENPFPGQPLGVKKRKLLIARASSLVEELCKDKRPKLPSKVSAAASKTPPTPPCPPTPPSRPLNHVSQINGSLVWSRRRAAAWHQGGGERAEGRPTGREPGRTQEVSAGGGVGGVRGAGVGVGPTHLPFTPTIQPDTSKH